MPMSDVRLFCNSQGILLSLIKAYAAMSYTVSLTMQGRLCIGPWFDEYEGTHIWLQCGLGGLESLLLFT